MISRILPYLKKHKKDPITNEPLEASQLITLHLTRAPDSTPICPVTTKNLQSISSSENQPVVVLTSGYVFAESTIKEFCYKAGKGRKSWNCLVTDQGTPLIIHVGISPG